MTAPHDSSRFAGFADSISGVDDPSMGDEREQIIILRAYTFGTIVATYAAFAVGIVLALIGVGAWSALVVVTAGVPGWAVLWYCAQHGIDLAAMTEHAGARRKALTYGSITVLTAIWLAAFLFHAITGSPLIPVELGFPGGGDGIATALGALVGGAVGVGAVVLALKLLSRRASRDDDAPDEA